MKRLVVVLSGLLVLPAFAEIMPISYDEIAEYSDTDIVDEDVVEETIDTDDVVITPIVQPSKVNPRGTSGATGRVASRVVPSGTAVNTRQAAGRVAPSRVASNATQSRGTVSRASTRVARSATNATKQIATTRRAMQNNGATTARSSIVQTDTVNIPLYTGRVSTRTSSAVRARIPTITSSGGNVSTSTTEPAVTTASMDELAQITDFCKAQYTQCMDNFCNVLDDNQGRCSCSKNIKNYAKTEEALKEATEALQDVAQQIQYIGLTSDEIETLFSQTEAELEMQKTSDNTQLKHDLDKIKDLIVDVKSGTPTATDTGLSFDLAGLLDFSIDSTGFDLTSLFGAQTNNTSINNQRGEQLYKTAYNRCRASVLNDCAAQGVDTAIITNAYDLEIDKQCIAYERSLTDTNDEMTQTVRNAKSVLQRARLLVAQQKNAYDMRGCVNALDACMQDEFVCGSDYENCLDPTGKYIVNGEVIVGSTPGIPGQSVFNVSSSGSSTSAGSNTLTGLYQVWGNNTESLARYINDNIYNKVDQFGDFDTTENSKAYYDMVRYLQSKIGYYDKNENKNYGMCMSVLNKCQDYTYTGAKASEKEYVPDNKVIREYLERTLIQIKAKQDEILADYAENCPADVMSCLAQNNYDPESTTGSRNNIAINACNSLITTCMSVNGITGDNTPTTINKTDWIQDLMSDK